ncbi:MAG: hypothetical protein N4A54_12640 [Peptostreptococcaceae bacterium]|jgi:hypothetical protein|nr:hypothetical protein [Peptostreptococcaceae bacterium]
MQFKLKASFENIKSVILFFDTSIFIYENVTDSKDLVGFFNIEAIKEIKTKSNILYNSLYFNYNNNYFKISKLNKDDCKQFIYLLKNYNGNLDIKYKNIYAYVNENIKTLSIDDFLYEINHCENSKEIYIGDKSTHLMHKEVCEELNNINFIPKNAFLTLNQGIKFNYQPCPKCIKSKNIVTKKDIFKEKIKL